MVKKLCLEFTDIEKYICFCFLEAPTVRVQLLEARQRTVRETVNICQTLAKVCIFHVYNSDIA